MEVAALVVSIIALAVAVIAAGFTRRQARAVEVAAAPLVVMSWWQRSLRLTFSGSHIERAVVTLVDGPVERIGIPGGTPDATRVVLTDVPTGLHVDLPAFRAGDALGRITVDVEMAGPGFRTVRRRVAADIPPPPFIAMT